MDLVDVRSSSIHGTGAFAAQGIPAGAPIGPYLGRRYSAEEVEQREWDHGVTYVFGLSDGSVIDGSEGGNAMRHINHSCAPNCIAYEVEDEDGRLAIEIEALRDIARGDELLLDYGLMVDDGDPADFVCGCGSPRCRGTLLGAAEPAEPRKRRRR